MANAKTTALTPLAAASDDDVFYVVDDPGGTPVSKKITLAALRTSLFNPPVVADAANVATLITALKSIGIIKS
jgi:hypothetical protein